MKIYYNKIKIYYNEGFVLQESWNGYGSTGYRGHVIPSKESVSPASVCVS